MNRSHRLFRGLHGRRRERLDVAASSVAYDAFEECRAFDPLMRQVEGDGIVDSAALHEATMGTIAELASVVWAALGSDGLAGEVGTALARAEFAARGRDARSRAGGSDRYVVEGCAATAQAAVLDRMFRAVREVMRRRALVDHRDDPCWPECYVRRHAEAEDARLGLTADGGGSGPDSAPRAFPGLAGGPSISGEGDGVSGDEDFGGVVPDDADDGSELLGFLELVEDPSA